MNVQKLTLSNLRCFKNEEFNFNPGMNLIVGINGVGKSTILEALFIMLSKAYSRIMKDVSLNHHFSYDDVLYKAKRMILTIALMDEIEFYLVSKVYVKDKKKLDRKYNIIPKKRKLEITTPPFIFFPATRASTYNKRKSAVLKRSILIKDWISWFKAMLKMKKEGDDCASRMIESMHDSLSEFWEQKVEITSYRSQLFLKKEEKKILIKQLSDGEKSILSLIFEITRNIYNCYKDSPDPFKSGKLTILIDEIDLHLHPKWQREIVGKLTGIFPNCQFICTTHSPFVIQSLRKGTLINLDNDNKNSDFYNKSIEDITEDIMGVKMPQKSKRYIEMISAAEEYYKILKKPTTEEQKQKAKEKLDELSIRYSDDPAYIAFLKVEKEFKEAKEKNETSK